VTIQTATYAEAYEELSKTIKWLKSLGLDPSRGRISQYHKNLGHWKDNYRSAPDDEVRRGFAEFLNTLQDVHDIVAVYRKFHLIPTHELLLIKAKLSKALNGPIKRHEERPNTTVARNFLFEALVAARLHHPEQNIQAILNTQSDTGFKFGSKKVWIECKRITSLDQLEKNIRDATRQLEKTFSKNPGNAHSGLVAIDVSKLFNDGSKILPKPTEDALLSEMRNYVEGFITKYRRDWEKVYQHRNKRIIGTLVRLSTMASVEERNLPTVATEWAVNPRDRLPDADHDFLQKLALTLNSCNES
jgi:hypothetical protein